MGQLSAFCFKLSAPLKELCKSFCIAGGLESNDLIIRKLILVKRVFTDDIFHFLAALRMAKDHAAGTRMARA